MTDKTNGKSNDADRIVEAIANLGESLGARIDRANDRIETLATGTCNGFARLETRLDEIARDLTGEL